jgi:predicted amidohydrolase YtcJ
VHQPTPDLSGSLLVRGCRLVPLATGGSAGPVDVRVSHGTITAVRPALRPRPGEAVLDAEGRWAMPGLWDAHVHLGQWSLARLRLDVGGTSGPDEVVSRVSRHVTALSDPTSVVLGYGHRSAGWSHEPTVAALDAVSGDHPVLLVSGDAHNGWLNSAALRLLGLAPRSGPLVEDEWFAVLPRLDALTPAAETRAAYRAAVRAAAERGVVGVGDMEFEAGRQAWPDRVAAGVDLIRVRTATYPGGLDGVLAAGLRTGDPLPGGAGLVTMGPLKVIFDGSLNTATAWCCQTYPSPVPGRPAGRGTLNLPPDELAALLARAARGGLRVAVHAIGDAAVGLALDAIAASGARGSVEHAQLVAHADLPRFAALGVVAGVQPAHLLDDRAVTMRLWEDRQDRCFPLRSLVHAGATLALGSDAPVAPLDPWLATAAAVHRGCGADEPWNPAESLTAGQALAASTDGRTTLEPGTPGDLVLLDDDPLADVGDSAATAAHLRSLHVAATVVAGRPTHLTLPVS